MWYAPSCDGCWMDAVPPRTMATRPVRTSSFSPYGSSMPTSASILSSVPVASTTIESALTSTIFARKTSTTSMIALRVSFVVATLISASSRATMLSSVTSLILTTSITL